MMKNSLSICALVILTMLIAVSCEAQNRNNPKQEDLATHYEQTEKYKRERLAFRARMNEGRRARGHLVIVKSQTKYGSDFVPTVYVTLQNKSTSEIKAFSLKHSEEYSEFNKQIKVRLKPNQTYSTSIRIPEAEGTGGDITLQVESIVYGDGRLVQVFN